MKNKKTILFFLIAIFYTLNTLACDICGCGIGSYYVGILPEFNKRFVGLRYQHKTLSTHLNPLGERTPITADETYQSAELWAGWNIGSKYRILAFLPYNYNKRIAQTGNGDKNGQGDIALMGYYNLLNNSKTFNEKRLVQSLWLGAGIKIPTGKYENTETEMNESPNNFQLGTASTDFTLNATYDIRLQDAGINVNMNYKINTENQYKYRYGNKFTTNVLAYYKFRFANISIAPNIGMLYETAEKDTENKKYEIATSGGYSLSAVAGIEMAINRFSIGANLQNIQSQNLANNRANGGNRLMIHTAIAF